MATLPIYTLTAANAQTNLQNDGLDALGLTTLALSPHWSTAAIGGYDSNQLTLHIAGGLRAPFRGLLEGAFAPASSTLSANITADDTTINVAAGDGNRFPSPTGGDSVLLTLSNDSGSKKETVACTARTGDALTVVRAFDNTTKQAFSSGDRVSLKLTRGGTVSQFLGADGQPLQVPCAVFRLHPQAVHRLERLMSVRYASNGAVTHPFPVCMLVRSAEFLKTNQFYDADATLPVNGDISFHDGRGLIVDPIYVASLFDHLLTWLPGLQPAGVTGGPGDAGTGIRAIAQTVSTTLVHFIDPHGANYRPVIPSAKIVIGRDGVMTPEEIPATALVTLGASDKVKADAGDDNRMRWGWATNGTLARADLQPPTITAPAALNRQFLRVMVADVKWSLLGNRSGSDVQGVQKDDGRIPPELLPEVRDQVVIDYTVDGPDTLAECARVLSRPNQSMIMAVSQEIDGTLILPPTQGATAHWPAFPAQNGAPGGTPPATLPAGSLTASFVALPSNDVVVRVTNVPAEAHIRIYPQQFVAIPAIAEEPSFVRGDGGANIADASGAADVLVPNPFRLANGGQRPSPATLTLDLVVAPRGGGRRLYGALTVSVANGPAGPLSPTPPFNGTGVLTPLLPALEGVGPSPLFGVPMPQPPATPNPSNVIDLAISLAAEPSPRQAPRLPTQSRFETVVLTGTTGPGTPAPTGTLFWDAIVTGGRLTGESRSAQHDLGNPGNPGGPDVHAPGVRVTGALAYDAALAAMRRVQPMIPWPTTNGLNPGWVVGSMGDNFNVPDDSANTTNTSVGVLLRTIAVGCETSQLSDQTPPDAGLTVTQMINSAATRLGLPAPNIPVNIDNEPRLQKEVRKEFFISKHGLRDVQWSLLRAISEARELIYIESPQFAPTARISPPAKEYQVDLVAKLADRLTAMKCLKVIICTPRLTDYAENFKSYSRYHYNARNEAVSMLTTIAPDRVAVFHPVGFPGRTAYIRTTSIIVDDVWSLVGTAHFRRRGMTFDGSVSIASFDRQLEDGYSKKVRNYRRALMGAKLHVATPIGGQAAPADWIRLSRPDSSFALVSDLLAQGGLGRIQPLWPGPSDTTVLAAQPDAADPDGSTSDQFMITLAGSLNELGD
ncbi:hypothetical protein [Edaphobacter sp. 12200R-103]|uniref:hypothetical protein n=1 Tax=Edaphobacter sp. 12200R-103 TaxID=2703788 RepID=UPI00138D1AE9|nr:hypothetical protein [Edaphobacter sp. 12200R-103]QHS52276.1 hypothetical protein GWR55_11475 [Edaphobacter sp. 12200R-103]